MNVRSSFRCVRARTAAALLGVAALCGAGMPAQAADNQATGDIAGNPANLGASNTFTINTVQLALKKAAFLANGTAIASGASVPRGTLVKFMIYIDNSAAVAADSVNVQDVLNAAFAYMPNSVKVDSSPATGSTEAQIFAAVDAGTPVSDAVGIGDVAGVNGTTVSAGNGSGNALLSVPPAKVWAMLFTVRVQ